MDSLTDAPAIADDDAPPVTPPFSIALDPFAYFGKRRSVLGPFGGDDRLSDPSYAFHTHYVEPPVGAAAFTIRLAGVKASCGTLNVRIHVIPIDHSAEARLLKTANVPLDSLAEAGGEVAYRIVAQPGKCYAVFGLVTDETDVVCSGVTITLNTVDDDSIAVEDIAESRRSVFSSGAATTAPHLLSQRAPSLAFPSSQLCTDRQFAEPAFRTALTDLGERPDATRSAWSRAFVLCALRQYGMLRSGGAALSFGVRDDAMPAIAAAAGCAVARVVPMGRDVAEATVAMRRPAICTSAGFDQHVTVLNGEPTKLPSDMRGYDFLWSTDMIASCASVADAFDFVSRTVFRLAAGGIAVHVFDLRVDANDEVGGGEPHLVLRRRHLERLAFMQLAAGHDVCQLRYAGGRFGAWGRTPDPILASRRAIQMVAGMTVTSFGIVIRRSTQ